VGGFGRKKRNCLTRDMESVLKEDWKGEWIPAKDSDATKSEDYLLNVEMG